MSDHLGPISLHVGSNGMVHAMGAPEAVAAVQAVIAENEILRAEHAAVFVFLNLEGEDEEGWGESDQRFDDLVVAHQKTNEAINGR